MLLNHPLVTGIAKKRKYTRNIKEYFNATGMIQQEKIPNVDIDSKEVQEPEVVIDNDFSPSPEELESLGVVPEETPTAAPKTYADRVHEKLYKYQETKSPEDLNEVIKSLNPVINKSIASIGGLQDPLIKSQAKIIAAKAIETYDPSQGAALHTWVANQLKQLTRFKRETQAPTKIPERTQLNAYTIYQAEMEFMDEHGREPDLYELADMINLSPKQIEKTRKMYKKMVSEGSMAAAEESSGDDGGGFVVEQYSTDYSNEALEYVYLESDYLDRKIIEMKTGYGGKYDPIDNITQIAQELGVNPSQVSRRLAKIVYRVQKMESDLEDTF